MHCLLWLVIEGVESGVILWVRCIYKYLNREPVTKKSYDFRVRTSMYYTCKASIVCMKGRVGHYSARGGMRHYTGRICQPGRCLPQQPPSEWCDYG